MKLLLSGILAAVLGPAALMAQVNPVSVPGADERFKADILVVVAHPDDEGAATPYLARAIYDQHKRVAVVFGTRGGSGGNDYRREHGPAMADVREIEARQACAALGITNVWFLGGKDTASQNVLNSLANWGNGASLEELVRIVRLTRPEVILAWLPGVFIGENHGDHQAAGVLATEAFDLADEATTFPAQLAGASKRLEPYLENLTPWQVKKIYYFSDADHQKQFDGKGPAYSVREVSPSQKKPYWRMALEAAMPHLTQFPGDIERASKMSDAQLEKAMSDPNTAWWPEPMTLIFGKSLVPGKFTDDVFAGTESSVDFHLQARTAPPASESHHEELRLAGPWGYYAEFRKRHGLSELPVASPPEIAIKAGSAVLVPLVMEHSPASGEVLEIAADVPQGWRVESGTGLLKLPKEKLTALQVEISTPALSADELKKNAPQEVIVRAKRDGKPAGEVRLRVLLKASALPE